MFVDDIVITPILDTLKLCKISDEEYFSPKYSNYVSNSRLGLLNPKQGGSPEKFFEGFKGGYSDSLIRGSAVHECCLQPEYFELAPDLGHPTAKLGGMADELYPIFKELGRVDLEHIIKASEKVGYYVGKTNQLAKVSQSCEAYWVSRKEYESKLTSTKEQIYLDKKSLDIVTSCINSINNHKGIQKKLHPEALGLDDPVSENEQAILLDVNCKAPNGKECILHLKAKLDNYTINDDEVTVNDIKTVGRVLPEFEKNIEAFRYSREFGVYIYLLKQCLGKYYNVTDPKIKANYLVVSTIPQYFSKVRPLTNAEIKQGFHEFRILLKYVAYCILYKGYDF